MDLLERVKQLQPDELAEAINAATRPLGVEITVYLIDHEQQRLWALPERGKPTPPPLAVQGTLAGKAFTSVQAQGPLTRMWVPTVDGSERLGVAEVVARRPPDDPDGYRDGCVTLVGLIGHLISVKLPYGDALQIVRRTRPMTPASELLLHLLPPLTYSCHRVVISAVLEPCYDVGGDAYDYAVDGPVARVAVFDAMGRGLAAGLTTTTAITSIRAARRAGDGLAEMARAADTELIAQFPDLRFVTGVLAELDTETGLLRYVNAGHPPPLLIRQGRVVKALTGGRRMPLGLAESTTEVGVEQLEHEDRLLLYTDGVTEAYDRSGDRFGTDRLAALTEQCMADGLPAPETLRRLTETVLEHQSGTSADDATLLLVEWSHEAGERTYP